MVLFSKLKIWSVFAFAVCLTLACLRAYRYPEYSTDGFSYMANAVAMRGASIRVIHDTVYGEAKAGIPEAAFNHLTGNDPVEPAAESGSFHERLVNPYAFAEFLPCFAIRPIFNELVYVLHFKLGITLLRATVLIPVVSYWLMGWIVWVWVSCYAAEPWAALISLLLLLSPPLWDLARSTTPDALSSMVVLLAMYLIFRKQRLLPGTILLMASVFIRTDNALLVLFVLAYMYMADFGLKAADGIVLSAVAVASVFLINHFAGDYGARVLYYRSFIGSTTPPGELDPRFGLGEYLAALRGGVSGAVHGPYIPFFLMGVVGVVKRRSRAILGFAAVTTAYTAAHLVIFPNPETRFFGPFFVAMGVALASTLGGSPRNAVEEGSASAPA